MTIINLDKISRISMNGSIDDGGWTATLTTFESGSELPPDREVTVDVKDYLGGAWDNAFNPNFRGFIIDPKTDEKWEAAENIITITNSQHHLKNGWLRATGFVETTLNQNMHRVPPGTLTSEYVIRHLLTRHTNLGRVIGFDIQPGGYSYSEITFQDSKFWESLDYLAKAELRMMFFDRLNIFHFKTHAAFQTGSNSAVMDFTINYMSESPNFTKHSQRVAQVQCFGFTDNLQEIASFYPPTRQDSIGDVVEYDSIRVGSQANLDTLAYRAYTWGNRTWEADINIPLNHNLEIGEIVSITYTDTDNGIAFSGAPFLITSMNFDIDLENTKWFGNIHVEQIP